MSAGSYQQRVLCGPESPICIAGHLVLRVPSAVAENTAISFRADLECAILVGIVQKGALG